MPHRFHVVQAKAVERELSEIMTPFKLKKDTDWSENGEIILKDQMRSEYWHTKYFSLLITITAFIREDRWVDCTIFLPANEEV